MILAVTKGLIDQFDDERRALARQLHSGALQHLAALQIQLSLMQNPTAERALELTQAC
jgi:signal transduction histidine kinase